MNTSGLLALMGVLLLATAWGFYLGMPDYQRKRTRQWFKCLFGKHDELRPVEPAVGGRNVQRCLWCDKVVREYQVTKSEAQKQTIRRI